MSSTANRVIKNTGFLYAKMGITMFISLYTTRLILNSLGASDFGIFNIVGGAIAMLGFLNAAMAGATQRFMSYSEGEGNKEKQKSIFNVSFILHLGISFMVGIALSIVGYFFFNGILNIPAERIFAAKVVYGSLIVSTMFTVMTVPYDASMNAHENMKYYAIVGVFESFLKLAVAIACVYTTFDKLIVYGSLMACIPLITLTIMRVYCHRHYEECMIAPRRYWDKGLMKEMTSFAGWNFLSTASSMISNYGLGIIINHFFGTLLNAAQGIANQINGQIVVLANNFIKATNPVMGKSAGKKDFNLLEKTVIESSRITTLLYSIIAIPLFSYTPYIFKIWLNNVPEWTIIFTKLIIIVNLIEFQFLSTAAAIRSVGIIKPMTKKILWINFIPLIFSFFLFKLGFEPYFLYITQIFSRVLLLISVTYYAKKYCRISYSIFFTKVIFPINLFVFSNIAISWIVLRFLPCNSSQTLIIHLLFYAIILFILLLIIINKEEKHIIEQLFQNIKSQFHHKK